MTDEDWMKLSEDLHDMCERMSTLANHLADDFLTESGEKLDFIESAEEGLDFAILLCANAQEHIYRLINKIGEYNEDSHS